MSYIHHRFYLYWSCIPLILSLLGTFDVIKVWMCCYVTDARASPADLPPTKHVGPIENYPLANVQGLNYGMCSYVCNIDWYNLAIDFDIIIVFHVNLL